MKRICSILLTAVLLLSGGCAPFCTVASVYVGVPIAHVAQTEHAHTDLLFSDLSDEQTDLSLCIAKTRELLFRVERGELSGMRAQQALEEKLDAFTRLRTAAAIAYVRYCADITNEAQKRKYDGLSEAVSELGCLLTDIQLLLSADPALRSIYDEQTIAEIRESDALTDLSVQPQREREQALIGAYDALETMTVTDGGRTWTKEEIFSDPTLSYETFLRLYRAYRSAYNERAGAIFTELIAVRNEIAKTLGFASYVEYAYAMYARDYSPEDAARLSAYVVQTFVPVFRDLEPAFYEATVRLGCGTFREEPTVQRTENVIKRIMPELTEPWEYMFRHGMYDFGTDPKRMPGSFTTYFEAYGAPFLFTSWDGSYEMPTTLLHEFGHYAGYYLNGVQRMQSHDPLDLAEIDSQGLELLAFSEYDELYGALSDAARLANLTTAAYAVITGCMEDAFQQYAYRTENVTVEMLNAEYARLADEFGLADMGLTGESWTEISHTFRAPVYYISYAASMLGALQLLTLCEMDRDAAVSAYRTILMRPVGAAFRDTLHAAGLCDPFDFHTATALAERIRAMCSE